MQPTGDDHLLSAYLAENHERCPVCGYELHMLRGRCCPECGEGLRLRIAPQEPLTATFVTGIVGLAAALGFSSMLFLLAAYLMIFHAGPSPRDVLVLIIQTGISGTCVLLWLKKWRWIRTFTPRIRISLAALCLLLPIVNMAVFAAVIR